MQRAMRIEISGRSEFWRKAVVVEWRHRFPERMLERDDDGGSYRIDPAWLADLERVAARCFSEVRIAPDDPGRRRLFRWLLPRRG